MFFGIELGTLYEAASDEAQVGGDFYDAFAARDDLVCLVVGDVTGKGLGAARFTAEVKFALRAYVQQRHDVSQSLALLNRFICHRREGNDGGVNAFVAVSAMLINTATGHGVCTLGGIESPLLYRVRTRNAGEIEMRGVVLGADAEATYDAMPVTMEQGDILILTTDGITEAQNKDRRFFELSGVARCMESVLQHVPDESPERIAQACLREAKQWANGKLLDDAYLLSVRYIGANTNQPEQKHD